MTGNLHHVVCHWLDEPPQPGGFLPFPPWLWSCRIPGGAEHGGSRVSVTSSSFSTAAGLCWGLGTLLLSPRGLFQSGIIPVFCSFSHLGLKQRVLWQMSRQWQALMRFAEVKSKESIGNWLSTKPKILSKSLSYLFTIYRKMSPYVILDPQCEDNHSASLACGHLLYMFVTFHEL